MDCDYYTDAITYTKVTILDEFAGRRLPAPGGDTRRRSRIAVGRRRAGASSADGRSRGTRRRRRRDGVADRRGCAHGEVHVVSRVVGFKKIKFYTNENVGSGELDLPEQQMHTTSYWLTIPAAVMAALPYGSDDRRDGVSGLAYAMRNVAQLLLMCDRQDIGLSVDAGDGAAATGCPGAAAGPG